MIKRLKTYGLAAALALGSLTGNADAAPMVTNEQQTPHHQAGAWDVSTYIGNFTRSDLNQAWLDYSDMLGQIADLPANVSRYSDDSNPSNNLTDFITGATSDHLIGADVGPLDGGDFGWSADLQNDGTIYVSADWLIPGVTFRRWQDQEKKEIELILADELLDGYDLALDPGRDIPDMATAQLNQLNVYQADGQAVNVVPEPVSGTLGLVGLAGLAARRRKRH